MNPCCNKLYAWPHFLTYIFNLHAYCTTPKWDTEGNNVMCDSSSRQSGAQLWWPLSLTSSWAQFISLSARLIWSMSPHCWHNSSSTAMQYCMCANVSIPFLPFFTTDRKNRACRSQTPFLVKICYFLYVCFSVQSVVNISQHHQHPKKFLNYIGVALKVETCRLRLCARINHSCLQLTAGGQEWRVHRAWPPAVKAGSDTAKAAADTKWTITAWPYSTWTEGRRNAY